MSAIAAIFWKDGRPADHDALSRLASGLRPFGRGGQQVRSLGSAGLARAFDSQRTASVYGDAPVIGGGADLMLVFEGRLDNRDELYAHLNIDPATAQDLPDSMIALRSWERWGASAVEYWLGDFAAICWNAAERTLVAVRDPLGMRGLSYHETPERIVIASAPRAMFALPDIDRQVDEQKIADSLVQLYHDGERSFFKDIPRLPMAGRLTVTATGSRIDRYWTPDDLPAVSLPRDDDYVEAAAELLGRAIKSRLRGATRVGAFMSGGLDSSTVAVSALDHLQTQDKLPTFTWVPEDGWDGRARRGSYGDERPFIEAIAAMHPRLEPHFVQAEGMGLFDYLDDFLDYAGVAPRNVMNFCWIHQINGMAAQQGIDVLLEGSAGNMSLSWAGDGLFLKLFKSGRFAQLARELFLGGGSLKGIAWLMAHQLLFPLAPDAVKDTYHRLRGEDPNTPLWYVHSAINPAFARDMRVQDRLDQFGHRYFREPMRDYPGIRKSMLSGAYMNEAADIHLAFRAIHGVESRDPLGDRRLVEFCLGLPEEQFRRNGESRWLVKRLMQGRLPDTVLRNRSSGEQVIDWHLRMTRDLPRIREELEAIADDPDTSRYIDVKRIKAFLDSWPAETPLNPKGHGYAYIPVSIGSALATGRFVRRVKGSNR